MLNVWSTLITLSRSVDVISGKDYDASTPVHTFDAGSPQEVRHVKDNHADVVVQWNHGWAQNNL